VQLADLGRGVRLPAAPGAIVPVPVRAWAGAKEPVAAHRPGEAALERAAHGPRANHASRLPVNVAVAGGEHERSPCSARKPAGLGGCTIAAGSGASLVDTPPVPGR